MKSLTLDPRRIALLLAVVVASLVAIHFVLQVYRFHFPPGTLAMTLIDRFDLDQEGTVPAYLSSLLLLGSGIVLASIALDRAKQPYARHWAVLAVIFCLLSLDEASSWHETLVDPVRQTLGLGLSGWLYWAWVVPGAAFVAVFAMAYLGFLRHLPARHRALFVLAGGLFVGGAIGMELVGGYLVSSDEQGFLYVCAYTIEEGLEMVGALTFLYALLRYKAEFGLPLQVQVALQG